MAQYKVDWSDDEVLAKVEYLAGLGNSEEKIAAYFGVHPSTMTRNKKKYAALREAIKRGKTRAVVVVADKLYEKAKEGNITAMIFFLKNRDPANWRDNPKEEDESRQRLEELTHSMKEAARSVLQETSSGSD